MTQSWQDVASLDGFAAGTMRQVELDGEPVLLVRDGDAVHAVGGHCPHAGAPLVEGVLLDGRIICPWHKAEFCLRTGAMIQPPAVDPLPRFDVRLEGDRIRLAVPPGPPGGATPSSDGRCFVIAGAGAAGAMAAQTLREAGFAGRIVMLDRENRVPYDRTLLSKYFLSGEKGAEKTPLQTQSFYREHRVERRRAEITHLDAHARQITCADGSTLRYDAALLATGAAPHRPQIPGADVDHVFLLRSRADAEAILAQAERSERAVILGASFIGMEVAASLRERGLDVTVVGRESEPFEKQLGAPVGAAFRALHERHGVAFRLGRGVAAFVGGPELREVVLDNGERLAADLAIIGTGVAPATSYVDGLTMREDGGIVVDAQLRAAEGLYAAGDIACVPYAGGEPIRVEHWRVALQHGRIAARNMLGQAVACDVVPVFWTIQYLKRLDYIGHAPAWDEIVLHGDPGKPDFLAYYVRHGLVAAAAGLDRDQDTAALVELFSMRRDWTAAALGEHPATVLARSIRSARSAAPSAAPARADS